jgi:DNA-binding transcriptional regulator YhcF (GntR family)
VDRGKGTYIKASVESMAQSQRNEIINGRLRDAVAEAVELGIGQEELRELLEKEYRKVSQEKGRSRQ